MGESIPEQDAGAVPGCAECQSKDIRPSRSFYPMDEAKIAGRNLRFWRCDNCGARFLGPRGEGAKPRRRGRKSSRRPWEAVVPTGPKGQETRKWLIPVMVILGLIVTTLFAIDRYNTWQDETGNIAPARGRR